jgi:predicted metal-binding protein
MTPALGVRKKAGKKKSRGPDRIAQVVQFALDKGAWKAKAFSARKVVVDERVRLKCEIPLCPHYGTTLTCPPNVPTVEEFRTALRRYRTAVLVQTRAPLSLAMDDFDKEVVLKFLETHNASPVQKGGEPDEARRNLEDVKLQAVRLHKLVNEVEAQAVSLGFHYALGLIGGDCMLCPKCAGPGTGCRRPYQARPAMEGVGIDVVKTSRNAGLAFDIPPKHEVVWSGLVLIE